MQLQHDFVLLTAAKENEEPWAPRTVITKSTPRYSGKCRKGKVREHDIRVYVDFKPVRSKNLIYGAWESVLFERTHRMIES